VKRDPNFDRRDLYIITQNGVGEPLYRRYLADQYSAERLQPANAFERWLGRADAYPVNPLVFPTEQEIKDAVSNDMEASMAEGELSPSLPHSVVTRLIWEKNRDAHEFFVEESFPLEWSYDHAEPHGLLYRISKEPVKELSPEIVRRDFEFWDAYAQKLKANPEYAKDYDARRSFSKLRASTGNLYQHRKMEAEAERAYRQALELWEGNGESIFALNAMLWERDDFEGVLAILKAAVDTDPNNLSLWQMYFMAEKRKELQGEISAAERLFESQPASAGDAMKLLGLYASVGDTNRIASLLGKSLSSHANDPAFLRSAVGYAEAGDLKESELSAAAALVAAEPDLAENHLLLARALLRNQKKLEFFAAARVTVEKGGLPMRETFAKSPEFESVRNETEFQSILGR
jgi:tetratricopeptide (TPR) repeat protein